jgi:hypothetical protein
MLRFNINSGEPRMRSLLAAMLLVLPLSLFAQQPAAPPSNEPPAISQEAAKPPAQESAAPESAKAPAPKKEVAPNDAVITLTGACPDAGNTSPAAECKSVVTRAEFERIKNALAPEAPESANRQIAQGYAQALVVNNEALKEGVQNDPGAEEVFKYARMRAMQQLLARRVQQNASNISDDEIKKYFEQNRKQFEEVVLTRLILPNRKGTKQKPVTPAMEKAYAERIRKRLLSGEKPAALQAEAFKRAALRAETPETNLGSRRRDVLPPSQAQVFDLKPGEVSQVLTEPSASFIYRVEARTTPELDPTITSEIRKTLTAERLQNEAKRIGQSAVPSLNPDYFGEEPPQQPVNGLTVPSQEPPPTK